MGEMEIFKKQDKSLGELLIHAGFIVPEQLEEALAEQKKTTEPLGKILVRLNYIKEEDIISVLKGLLVVVFAINKEYFGVEIVYLREILKYRKITPLPILPPYMKGIISVRDSVIPVISLANKIFGKNEELTDNTRIIVIESKSECMGILVDDVMTVKNYSTSDFENTNKYSLSLEKKYISGLIKDEGNIITLIKPEILFKAGEDG